MTVYLNLRVPLANGKGTALVHAMDYELVMQYTWHLRSPDASHHTGYARRSHRGADGKWHNLFMHQFLTGQKNMDHKNLNGLDNRRSNLRPGGKSQSVHRGKLQSNTSGMIGVSRDKQRGKWRAEVWKNGKRVWRARFDDLEEAGHTRDAKAVEYHGAFAVLNFSDTA